MSYWLASSAGAPNPVVLDNVLILLWSKGVNRISLDVHLCFFETIKSRPLLLTQTQVYSFIKFRLNLKKQIEIKNLQRESTPWMMHRGPRSFLLQIAACEPKICQDVDRNHHKNKFTRTGSLVSWLSSKFAYLFRCFDFWDMYLQ